MLHHSILTAYHISHASGALLHPVYGSPVKPLQGRLPLGQELVWEVTIEQHLLPPAGQSQNGDTRRHLKQNQSSIFSLVVVNDKQSHYPNKRRSFSLRV